MRGFVYEGTGTVDPILLARGCEAVEAAADTWNIPVSTILADPADSLTWADPLEIWLETATDGVLDLTGPAR